jgi:hypothetical protein
MPVSAAWHYFSCDKWRPFQCSHLMSKTAASQPLLQLLVRVYNQSIQTYFHFPDVIICGHHRLEVEEFQLLINEGYAEPYYCDSFGKIFRLTRKAIYFLQQSLHKRKSKAVHQLPGVTQVSIPFSYS